MKTKLGILTLTLLTAATIASSAQAHTGPGLTAGHLHPFSSIDNLVLLFTIGLGVSIIAASLRYKKMKLSRGKCSKRSAPSLLRGRF